MGYWRTMTKRVLCALALALAGGPAAAADLSGSAKIIDGDTIEIGGVRIDLYGIDAPEPAQTCEKGGKRYRCGEVATEALRKQITGPVRCTKADGGTSDRIAAKCTMGYLNLNAWMVTNGYAVADVKNARDYVAKEAKARRALRGVWHGRFEYPWIWRKANR